MVERDLAKVEVASSSLVSRSKFFRSDASGQKPKRRFNSLKPKYIQKLNVSFCSMNCKRCNIQILTRLVIDGKVRNFGKRKYCLFCSPFKANNRQKLEKDTPILEGTKRNCLSCLKSYIFRRHRAMTIDFCSACFSKQRRRKIKLKAVENKGGKCQECGYNKCVGAMDFHHLTPQEKDFTISGNAGRWENIKKELDKCVLLCKNCHAERHYLKAA